ncbi:MAG: hypothetical protein NT040_01580 [Bacteroidetes bacterium]|nr:hypothetical protein [Bacteroidota bacterium]
MQCDYIQQHIADLFDDTTGKTERDLMMVHIGQCPDCRKDWLAFQSLSKALQPGGKLPVRNNLMESILDKAGREEIPAVEARHHPWKWNRSLQIAASILLFAIAGTGIFLLLTYRTPAFAAGRLLDRSIRSMRGISSVKMVFSMRTAANENFETIDPAAGFLTFEVYRLFGNERKWRFDKPGRMVIMDGKDQFMVNKNGGYVMQGSPEAGFTGWLKLFLEPAKVLEAERSIARNDHASCSIKEEGGWIDLTFNTTALGNYDNHYALNSSIPEANTRRVYTFDKESNMLHSLTVFVRQGKEEICVLKLNSIIFNEPMPDSLFVFENRNKLPVFTTDRWQKIAGKGIRKSSSEAAARLFLSACSRNDWNTVKRFSPLFSMTGREELNAVKDRFAGTRVINVGKSFVSGLYAGEFVPFTVVTLEGVTITGNLALRNDNPGHAWIVDGGY